MKYLYIRRNVIEKYHIIVGDESSIGGRDNAYKSSKGSKRDSVINWPEADVFTLPDSMRDYDIHKFLKEELKEYIEWDGERDRGLYETREAFLFKKNHRTEKDYKFVISEIGKFIQKVNDVKNNISALSFKSEEQKQCCDKLIAYSKRSDLYFLVNAICRFGKTWTALYSILKSDWKTAAFVSYKTESRKAFEEDYIKYFSTYITAYTAEEYKKANKNNTLEEKYVIYDSVQKLRNILPNVDVVFFDEAQYGNTEKFEKDIKSKAKKIVYLSGTPQDLINSGLFSENNTYEFTLVDMWKKVKSGEWIEGKDCLLPRIFVPQFEREIKNIKRCNEEAKNWLLEGIKNGFSFSALFETDKNDGLIRREELELFTTAICRIIENGLDCYEQDHKDKLLNYILFVPMGIKSAEHFADMVRKHFGQSANVFCATGSNNFENKTITNDNLYNEILKRIDPDSNYYDANKYNIVITYQRFGVGSTFKNMQAVMFLNDSDSIVNFVQNMMRASTVNHRKKWFPVFELSPQKALADKYKIIFNEPLSHNYDDSEYETLYKECEGLLPIDIILDNGNLERKDLTFNEALLSYKKWAGRASIFDYVNLGKDVDLSFFNKIEGVGPTDVSLKDPELMIKKAKKALKNIKKNLDNKKSKNDQDSDENISKEDILLSLNALSDYIKTLWILSNSNNFNDFEKYFSKNTNEFEDVCGITYKEFCIIKAFFVNKTKIELLCNSFKYEWENSGKPRSMLHTASKEFFTNAILCDKMTQCLGPRYNNVVLIGDFDLNFFSNKNIKIIADPGTCLIAKKLYNVKNVFPLILKVDDKKVEKEMLRALVNIIKNMNFDHIIMNPPYDDLGNTIAENIMDVARQHADKVVCLNQVNFFKSPYLKVKVKKDGGRANRFTDLLKHIENIETIPRNEFNKFFNIGGASDGAIIVLTKEETKYFDTFNESVFFKFCSEENSILSKANRDKQTPYYVVLKRQSYSVDDIDFIEDNDKHLGKDKRNFLPIYFDTENEKENFIKCYNTKFMKRFLQTLKSGKTTPIGLLPFMPTYAHPWNDEMLYEYFDLTPEQVNIIEQDIK